MAKIETKFTFNNHICTFIKNIGKLAFYTYDGKDDSEHLLIVANDKSNTILADVEAVMGDGAYGGYFEKFNIKEVI